MTSEVTKGVLDRLTLYCSAFGLPLPPLEYDQDEPEELVMTGGLMDFVLREGISLDWLICGRVVSDTERRFAEAFAALSEHERMRLVNAMRAHVKGGLPLSTALALFGLRVDP